MSDPASQSAPTVAEPPPGPAVASGATTGADGPPAVRVWPPLLTAALLTGVTWVLCSPPQRVSMLSPDPTDGTKVAAVGRPVHGAVPPVDRRARLEALLRSDPVGFLDECIAHAGKVAATSRGTLVRRERIGRALQPDGTWSAGKLKDEEEIDFLAGEDPHRIYLEWKRNPQGAGRLLYVAGANEGKMLVRPSVAGLGGLLTLKFDPADQRLMRTTRYPVTEFGFRAALQRARDTMAAARSRGALHVEVSPVASPAEGPDRPCFVLRRHTYDKPDADGVGELRLHVDCEDLIILRSEMRGADGTLIGLYRFPRVMLSPPDAEAGQFTAKRFGF